MYEPRTNPALHQPLVAERVNRKAWMLYLAAVAFLILRTPYEVIHGLVEGEEGTVYLRYAWDSPVLRALFAPHQGYYSLLPNLCGVLAARVLPLEFAGHFFVFSELAVHMLLVYMLVQCECFPSLRQKGLAVAVGLLTVPTVAIVLCTDNAQFFLAVMSGVILISNADRLRGIRVFALIFAGLNGVLSCVLLPFFLWRAWKERSVGRLGQAIGLAACTLVQASVVLAPPGAPLGRHSTLGFFAAAFLVNSPLSQFFTRWAGVEACRAIGSPKLLHWEGTMWFAVEFAAVLWLAGVFYLMKRGGPATRLLGTAAALALSVCLFRGGTLNYDLMCGSGARYFFMFNLFVGLGLVIVQLHAHGKTALVARVLVLCSLFSGLTDLTLLIEMPHSPVWAREVALWRADPKHRLRIGPGAWPGVNLTPQPGNQRLPANIYDSTVAGWQER